MSNLFFFPNNSFSLTSYYRKCKWHYDNIGRKFHGVTHLFECIGFNNDWL